MDLRGTGLSLGGLGGQFWVCETVTGFVPEGFCLAEQDQFDPSGDLGAHQSIAH